MVDLRGKEMGNISLPERLHSPNIEENDYLLGEEQKVMIINMQKTMYEIKIADLEKRIKRLEDQNAFILDECTTTDLLIKSKDTETTEEISELRQELFQETKKMNADDEKIKEIEQLRLKNKEEHEKNMKLMQERYDKTRLYLVSQMKILKAKINTLEDFKITKEALEQKLKDRDQKIKDNEEKVQWMLEQISRKFKIATEKMKNDLYKRLLSLSADFQVAISRSLSLPIHRLIRENVAIQNEIIQIFNENILKHKNTTELGYAREIYNYQIEENRKKIIRRLITCKIQDSLLSTLKTNHSKVKKRLTDARICPQYSRKDQEILEKLQMQENELDFRRRQLEVNLHQIQTRQNLFLNKKRQFRYMIKKLKQILYDVKFAASCALKIFGFDEDIAKMSYNQLLLFLLSKITENKSEAWIKPINSTETIFPIDDTYRTGDLGFDPHESKSEIISLKKSEPSFSSGLEFLKQFEKENLEKIFELSQIDYEKSAILIQSAAQSLSFDDSKITISNEGEEEEEEEEEKKEVKFVEDTKVKSRSDVEVVEIDIEEENEGF